MYAIDTIDWYWRREIPFSSIFFIPVSRLTIWLSGRSPGLPPKVPPEAPGDLSRFRRQAKSRVSGRRRVDRLICDSQRETKKTIWIIWIILYIYIWKTPMGKPVQKMISVGFPYLSMLNLCFFNHWRPWRGCIPIFPRPNPTKSLMFVS